MKTAGWICLFIGIVSFFGASLKGNSVFGPSFWIAMGVLFLYRGKKKDQKDERENNTNISEDPKVLDIPPAENDVTHIDDNEIQYSNPNSEELESVEEIQSKLTMPQREASMCLVAYFGGFVDDKMSDVMMQLSYQASYFFGIEISPLYMSQIMSRYSKASVLIETILTIKHTKAREFLLLTCYDMVRLANKDDATQMYWNLAKQMGYEATEVSDLINKYH